MLDVLLLLSVATITSGARSETPTSPSIPSARHRTAAPQPRSLTTSSRSASRALTKHPGFRVYADAATARSLRVILKGTRHMRLIDDDILAVLCIWAEARGESKAGKIAVAEVLLNRTRLRYNSDGTLAGTIFRDRQFSWANHNNPWRATVFTLDWNSPQVQECREAWEYAKGGSYMAKGAVLYHADYVSPTWASAVGVALVSQHGRHLFYTDSAAK